MKPAFSRDGRKRLRRGPAVASELRWAIVLLAATYAVLAVVSLAALLGAQDAASEPGTGIPVPLVGELQDDVEHLPGRSPKDAPEAPPDKTPRQEADTP